MTDYKGPVCRGSWILGTACQRCERCIGMKPRMVADVALPPMGTDPNILSRLATERDKAEAEALEWSKAFRDEAERRKEAEQRERELREANDRLMIAAAATVKASMDQYKRGHADGAQKGFADGLEQAARIARAAQYSKTPATDTMRNIERLIDGLSIVKGES